MDIGCIFFMNQDLTRGSIWIKWAFYSSPEFFVAAVVGSLDFHFEILKIRKLIFYEIV